MPRIVFCALALAIMAGRGDPLRPNPAATTDTEIRASDFAGTYGCTLDRIIAGPDDEVAIWTGDDQHVLGTMVFPPGEVIIGRMHDPASGIQDRLSVYSGGGRPFFPIRWAGQGGVLFARTRDLETRILALNADGTATVQLARLGPAWRPVALNALGHGGIEPLLQPSATARAKRIDGKTYIRGHATLGSTLELLGARRSDLTLERIDKSSVAPVGLNAAHTRWLTVFHDADRYWRGVAYAGAPARGRLGYLPYQRPLVDQKTGRVAGSFGPGGILLEGKSRLSRRLAIYRRTFGEKRIVVDASLSGDTLMALTLSGRGNRAVVRIAPAGISERPLCTDSFEQGPRTRRSPNPLVSPDTVYRPLVRTFGVDRRGREALRAGLPIMTVYHLGNGAARDAVILMPGGPGGSTSPGDRPLLHIDRLLSPDRDIISIGYAGSIGGGRQLTDRLGERGIAALDEDMDAVVRWLNRREYRRVFIVATSFGGIPALVALDRHRGRFAATFLFAPVLRWPEPEEHVDRGRFDSVMADTQMSFEQALLGGVLGRERFKRQLASLVARAPLAATDHFYFAERDPTSSAADLPVGTAARHQVVNGTIHMTIFAAQDAWRDIEEKVQ